MKERLLKLAWHLKSDHFSVLACLLITIAQACHTYFLVLYSSRLDSELLQHGQAVIFAITLSLGLLVNVFKVGSTEDIKLKSVYIRNSLIFAVLEVFINTHYWAKAMIYENYMNGLPIEWYDFSAALVLSFVLPWLLYTYAGSINIPELIDIIKDKPFLLKVLGNNTDESGNLIKGEYKAETKSIK